MNKKCTEEKNRDKKESIRYSIHITIYCLYHRVKCVRTATNRQITFATGNRSQKQTNYREKNTIHSVFVTHLPYRIQHSQLYFVLFNFFDFVCVCVPGAKYLFTVVAKFVISR